MIYFITGRNIIKDIFVDFYHDLCCTSSVYFEREYSGEISSLQCTRNTSRIQFEGIDTTYIMSRYILSDDEKQDLIRKVKPGMFFASPLQIQTSL